MCMKIACSKKTVSMTGVGFGVFYEAGFYHAQYSVLQFFFTCNFYNENTSQETLQNSEQGGEKKCYNIESSPKFLLHLDVIDGNFILTWNPRFK